MHMEETSNTAQCCAICLDDVGGDAHATFHLPCKHAFHDSCILDVFRRGDPKCPVCRDVPQDVKVAHNRNVQMLHTATQPPDQIDETIVRMIEDALHQFIEDLEEFVYSGARGASARRRMAAIVPPRLVISAETAASGSTPVTPVTPVSLSVVVGEQQPQGEDPDDRGRPTVDVAETSLHQNRAAREDLARRDGDLRNLRNVAEHLRSACIHRGTIMQTLRCAIDARSPNLVSLLRGMERDHELFRMRAEVAQRLFVDMANTRLGIREHVALF